MAKKLDIDNSFNKLADTIKQQKESAESQYSIQKKEMSISEITNLEQATAFIKKRDREVYINMLFLAHTLKKVRDEKLYLEKYDSFENYYTNELNYERRSIYNFLKIADFFPLDTSKEIVQLGVRKLLELSNPILTEEERKNYIEENALQEKSSSEIKEELKNLIKNRKYEEQKIINSNNTSYKTSYECEPDASYNLEVFDNLNTHFTSFVTSFSSLKDLQIIDISLRKENVLNLKKQVKDLQKALKDINNILSKY